MGMDLTVLLVEADAERGSRLEVLLRIAGYRIVPFATVEEAINWSTACSKGGGREVCLLNSVSLPVLELALLLEKVRTCRVDLPLLVVNRALPTLATHPDARRQLAGSGVYICEPTEIVAALAEILRQSSAGLTWNREWNDPSRRQTHDQRFSE